MRNCMPVLLAGFLGLAGCATPDEFIDKAISRYEAVESQIQLGDPKDKVLSIIEPTQRELESSWRKKPEKYIKEGVLVEIYYARSARQADGLTTDDEFTPYVFNDGKLVDIGWTAIGGAKSQGQTTPTTNVNVQQHTIIY
jgi:hypothetical protein